MRDATYAARYRESLRTHTENNHKRKDTIQPPPPALKRALPRAKAKHFTAENLDLIARIIFAICFFIFNFAYWPFYLYFYEDDAANDDKYHKSYH